MRSFSPWHFTRQDVNLVVSKVGSLGLDEASRTVLLRSAAMLARLLNSQTSLETLRKSLMSSTQWPKDDSPKYSLYEATEDFFCDYYGALNSVRAALEPQRAIFGSIPRGASGIVSWFGARLRAEHFAAMLEHALRFRALIEHPQLNQPYTWAVGVATPHIFLYGTPSLSGSFPQGATAEEGFYSVGLDGSWAFVAPDDQLVLDYLGLFWLGAVETWVGQIDGRGISRYEYSGSVGWIEHCKSSSEFRLPQTTLFRWPLDPGNVPVV